MSDNAPGYLPNSDCKNILDIFSAGGHPSNVVHSRCLISYVQPVNKQEDHHLLHWSSLGVSTTSGYISWHCTWFPQCCPCHIAWRVCNATSSQFLHDGFADGRGRRPSREFGRGRNGLFLPHAVHLDCCTRPTPPSVVCFLQCISAICSTW